LGRWRDGREPEMTEKHDNEKGKREGVPANPLIVALDLGDWKELEEAALRLKGTVETVKVGLEAYAALGPAVLEMLKREGFRVFVDLKLHDIPRTAGRAVRALAEKGADLLTLHCAGGLKMLEAACEEREALRRKRGRAPLLLGVTVLTSLEGEDLRQTGVPDEPEGQVLRLARLAMRAGLDGLVASARELPALRKELGSRPLLVVPGIRPAGTDRQDQARVGTPASAMRDGADYLVVGRPVLQSDDPARSAREILEEMGWA
jgi:orotidine-5'-phosphate decarboxylase